MKDIAQQAGVTKGTVSLALRGGTSASRRTHGSASKRSRKRWATDPIPCWPRCRPAAASKGPYPILGYLSMTAGDRWRNVRNGCGIAWMACSWPRSTWVMRLANSGWRRIWQAMPILTGFSRGGAFAAWLCVLFAENVRCCPKWIGRCIPW
ncbi:LacI family transcriptional regulator [Opitutaceae bacterium TAV4]|nr:LacI family transcriptional regulator [Opitutaceae bacterium TAV4]